MVVVPEVSDDKPHADHAEEQHQQAERPLLIGRIAILKLRFLDRRVFVNVAVGVVVFDERERKQRVIADGTDPNRRSAERLVDTGRGLGELHVL